MRKIGLLIIIIMAVYITGAAQSKYYSTANAHSHNDYEQSQPFYDAYARHFGSIEADVWAVGGKLIVAHSREDVDGERTFSDLYLKPFLSKIKANDGSAYKDGLPLQLLIDLKSPYSEVIPILLRLFAPYRKYFDIHENSNAVRIVLSGNMPPPDSMHYFDPIFTFDGRIGPHYKEEGLKRIKLVSDNIQKFVRWSDAQKISVAEFNRLQRIVDSVHQQGKLIRFWATPNTAYAYKTLMRLGVDYIGSDDLGLLQTLLTNKNTVPLHLNRRKIHE